MPSAPAKRGRPSTRTGVARRPLTRWSLPTLFTIQLALLGLLGILSVGLGLRATSLQEMAWLSRFQVGFLLLAVASIAIFWIILFFRRGGEGELPEGDRLLAFSRELLAAVELESIADATFRVVVEQLDPEAAALLVKAPEGDSGNGALRQRGMTENGLRDTLLATLTAHSALQHPTVLPHPPGEGWQLPGAAGVRNGGTRDKLHEAVITPFISRSGTVRGEGVGAPPPLGESDPLGVVLVFSGGLADDDLRFLELVGAMAGTAVARTHRTMEARRAAEDRAERLSNAVVQSADSIFITDREGLIEYVNPAFEEVTGYAAEEVIGRRQYCLNSGRATSAISARLWNTIVRGEAFKAEFVNKAKGGRLFRELKTITPVRDHRGAITHFVSVARDVTRERELEDQLAQAQKMEAVGRLAGGIAHDFNNFLSVMTGHAQLLLHQLKPEDPLRGDVEGMSQAAHRAGALVQQLLAFSRKQVLTPEIVDVNRLLVRMESLIRPLVGERIAVSLDLQTGLYPVRANRHQLEQVLMNLVVNARDAMPDGGMVLFETRNVTVDAAEAERRSLPPGPSVLIGVSDSGEGIPAELQGQIFEPFFTTKQPGTGTGLGLSTVYGIVRQAGGEIRVDSEVGRGTTFSIFLPRLEGDPVEDDGAEAGEGREPRRRRVGSLRGNETILVVEDSSLVRAVTRSMLEDSGYRVVEAADGERALEVLREMGSAVHLLFTDVIMPGMSGPELAMAARDLDPRLPILFMSGYPDPEGVGRADVLRRHHLLLKPFHIEDLLQAVRDTLDARSEEESGGIVGSR